MSFKLIFLAFTALVSTAFGAKKGSETSFAYMSETTPFKYSEFKDIIIFGDSYTTVSLDFNTMTYTGSNMSGGKNWPQFLIDPIHPMKMWNFAVSGAAVDPKVVGNAQFTPMTEQYSYFLKNMGTGKKYNTWKGETTLFAIWFGINDLGAKNRNDSSIDERIADSMFSMVEGMYKEGARHFMFIYVPNIEKCPTYANNNTIKTYVPIYNNNLNKYAKNFQATHPNTNVMVYDSYTEFEYIMENKAQYGITNITGTCGGFSFGGFGFGGWGQSNNCDPKNYFWADVIHPTPAVHEPLAVDMDVFLQANEKNQKLSGGNNNTNNNTQGSCWSTALGYPCCKNTSEVVYVDESGEWGVENNNWCGIAKTASCWAKSLGFECCSTNSCRNVVYTDNDGKWDVENNQWCGITSANTIC
jgi:hypothetical protein